MDSSIEKSMNEIITDAVAYLMKNHAPKAFSQAGLAKVSGVSQGTICMNLKGERGWSIDVLDKLCPSLGVPLEDLVMIGKELRYYTSPPISPRSPRSIDFKFKIGDVVVLKRELLESAVSRKDVRLFTVYAVYLTDEGVQYQVNDPKAESQEEWEFLKEEDLIPLTSAKQARDKIRKALELL
jgi:transcriptional regulator with XRE-family HTH domain